MRTDKTDNADDADKADNADNADNIDNTDNGIAAVMLRLQAGGHPKLDTENSERIADYDYAYQYCLNMGYNAECEYEKGFGFFMHCFRNNRPYTGGCVAVPENIMKFVMQHVKPGCRITIDSLENFGGDLDA